MVLADIEAYQGSKTFVMFADNALFATGDSASLDSSIEEAKKTFKVLSIVVHNYDPHFEKFLEKYKVNTDLTKKILEYELAEIQVKMNYKRP